MNYEYKFETSRGGYKMKYYFNAGLNNETGVCDEEGTDVFYEDTDAYIGNIVGYTPSELEEMSESRFQEILEENYII